MMFRNHFILLLAVLLPATQAMVQLNRRTCWEILQMMPLVNWVSTPASAATDLISEAQPRMPIMPDNLVITDKVFMDVRIARNDGSTYVRDDLDGSFENTVLFQTIKIGLYGKLAPNHVEKFLSYIETPSNVDAEELLDNPFPSYSRSTFPSLDQETGLLMGGNIPSLRVKDVAGTTALTYGNRVLPATLWVDRTTTDRISHSTKGLLTHRNLEVLPAFGITTRSQLSLDATHTVFGQVLWNEDTLNFFRDLEDIPTYSVERPSGLDDFNTGDVATSVYNAQREFFRGAAKTFGDDRVSKLYDGKLLRRMEVLQVGRL
jgi:cyclophilin family peptidyl-prolyl cis-trans isomerase